MPDDHASSPEPCGSAARTGLPARRVRVLLPLPLPEALDYLAPEGTSPPEPGSFVRVPLGQRSLDRRRLGWGAATSSRSSG